MGCCDINLTSLDDFGCPDSYYFQVRTIEGHIRVIGEIVTISEVNARLIIESKVDMAETDEIIFISEERYLNWVALCKSTSTSN